MSLVTVKKTHGKVGSHLKTPEVNKLTSKDLDWTHLG